MFLATQIWMCFYGIMKLEVIVWENFKILKECNQEVLLQKNILEIVNGFVYAMNVILLSHSQFRMI